MTWGGFSVSCSSSASWYGVLFRAVFRSDPGAQRRNALQMETERERSAQRVASLVPEAVADTICTRCYCWRLETGHRKGGGSISGVRVLPWPEARAATGRHLIMSLFGSSQGSDGPRDFRIGKLGGRCLFDARVLKARASVVTQDQGAVPMLPIVVE